MAVCPSIRDLLFCGSRELVFDAVEVLYSVAAGPPTELRAFARTRSNLRVLDYWRV